MIAPVFWSSSGTQLIAIEGTFDTQAAHQLGFMLRHLADACIVDFCHAMEIQPDAMAILLTTFDEAWPRADITVRGLSQDHLAVIESFGYELDGAGRLLKTARPRMG